MTPQQAIEALLQGRRLDAAGAEAVMDEIAAGGVSPAQVGALLALLASQAPAADTLTGFARALRRHAVPVEVGALRLVDTCGTGGDGTGTLNISTLAGLVVAAAGESVAKHGNRSVSSRVGSADLLEALGLDIQMTAPRAAACLQQTGFAFLFAPLFHPAWRHVGPVRRELGVRTVFNVLGPLVNPSTPQVQLLGVYEDALVPVLAAVLRDLGVQDALVVHGEAGEDEISLAGPTHVAILHHARVTEATWQPEDVGIGRRELSELRGGDLETNQILARRVLDGEPGALQDAVVLNAGAALYVAGRASDWRAGVEVARDLLASGQVSAKLAAVVAFGRLSS